METKQKLKITKTETTLKWKKNLSQIQNYKQ